VLGVAHGETVVPPELAAGLATEIRLRAAAQNEPSAEPNRANGHD
jgi:hypothetical protein